MFLCFISSCFKAAKIGAVALLVFMVNVGYAADLYVGFHGVNADNKYIYVENILSNGPISPVNFHGDNAISTWPPSMAEFNGNFFMAYRGPNERMYYSWSQDARHWNATFTPDFSLQTDATPRLQVFNGRLYLFYIRPNNHGNSVANRLYYTSTADGFNWTVARRLPAGRSAEPPSTAVFNGRLYLVYRGRSSNHVYYNTTTNGTTWAGERQIPTIKSSKAPSAAVHNNQLFLAFKGSSTNNVYLIRSSNGLSWSASWRPNPSWQTEKGPAIASYNNRLYLAHRDLSKNVRYSSSANGINSWGTLLSKSGSRSGGSLTLAVY